MAQIPFSSSKNLKKLKIKNTQNYLHEKLSLEVTLITASSNNQAGGRHVIDLWDFCDLSPKMSQKMFFMVLFFSQFNFYSFLSIFESFGFSGVCLT